jgi:TPR repeat protein
MPGRNFREVALAAAAHLSDPWATHHIEREPLELVKRKRFVLQENLTWGWVEDYALVKMQRDPFAAGSMRNCFRMKKKPQPPNAPLRPFNWKRAPNYVAKCYKQKGDHLQYCSDVELQTRAGHSAALFNVRNPPKKIDMLRMFLLEFVERPEDDPCRFVCVERFIEGEYVKHNSNAGFVDDLKHRMTPQAFSHFSFVASDSCFMVVDVQGVGDLYTDPQIHSADGRFGDGDFGFRGMALFLSTHCCNPVCKLIGLQEFPLSSSEHARLPRAQASVVHAATVAFSTAAIRSEFKIDSETISSAPSSLVHVDVPIVIPTKTAESKQGLVHLELARLNLEGRFTDKVPDSVSCVFHLQTAASFGVREALVSLARACSHSPQACNDELLPSDFLETCSLELDKATELWIQAAEKDSIEALVLVGRASQLGQEQQTGEALPILPQQKNWNRAFRCYTRALDLLKSKRQSEQKEDGVVVNYVQVEEPILQEHQILFEAGQICFTGGFGLDKNWEKALEFFYAGANLAMQQGDRFISSQCFELAAKIEE